MTEKYEGEMGSAKALDGFDPKLEAAYRKATDAMRDAIIEFEQATGRTVSTIALVNIDVSTFGSKAPKTIRQTELRFLPKPGEVSW